MASSLHAQRMVFAHYMLSNQDYAVEDATGESSIAGYERDIREAQAVGIDGFALNAGGWFKEPRYIRRASEMFEAATRLNSNFKLMFSADMCCGLGADDIEDMVRRFANNPRYSDVYLRHKGRFVLSTFSGSKQGPEFWRQLRSDLESGLHPSLLAAPNALPVASGISSSAPVQIELVPAFFFGGELPSSSQTREGLAAYNDVVDGIFYWGIAGVPGLGHAPDQLPSSEAYASAAHALGKLYMAPICFQFWGANANRYYEYGGYSGMRSMWMDAIHVSHPEWVEIITWNDFVEGTYISPISDPEEYPYGKELQGALAQAPHYFHSHRGATEILRYYIQWYKTGRQPVIKFDQIYWAYRTQILPPSATAKDGVAMYGEVQNAMYVTANLKAAATLEVTTGKTRHTIQLKAGSVDIHVPMMAGGPPYFRLTRGSTVLAQGRGADDICNACQITNFYYSTGSLHD
jgi:glucan endo-1,3-alpha-glucosidase